MKQNSATIAPTFDVYYISGSTGLLARDLGKALLSQFPHHNFRQETLPFIRNRGEAYAAYKKITAQSGETSPIVISSLFSKELNAIFNQPNIHLLTVFDQFLASFEKILLTEPIRRSGTGRRQDDSALASRVSAIDYSIAHDDGSGIEDYDGAELILLGVSRSGKTPISVFLATQLGMKSANYPLVERDLEQCHLPAEIRRNRHKTIGLMLDPTVLQRFRQNRYPGSRYADLATCRKELRQASVIFEKYNLRAVPAGGSSIEETAMLVANLLGGKNA